VHYKVEEVSELDGQVRASIEYEFWSRENRYFRLDIYRPASSTSKSTKARQRLIVRPEGFALLETSADSEQFAVTAFGSSAEGLDRLLAMPTVHSSTRAYLILTIEDLLKSEYESGAKRRIVDYKLEGDMLTWDSKYTSGDTVIASRIVCNVKHGVCLQYEARSIKAGEISSDVSVERVFDFNTHRSIPVNEVVVVRKPKSSEKSERRNTLFVDWQPVDMSVFDIAGVSNDAPRGSPWLRRIATLVIGSLLVGAYLLLRQRGRRAS
ncbi:MAG: hypothetical protein WBD31_22820, partial [Rubripirellula sp.]